MSGKVIIYGKAGWPYTDKARAAFEGTVEYHDVRADRSRFEEMLKLSGGVRQVPVIVENGKITIGFGGT